MQYVTRCMGKYSRRVYKQYVLEDDSSDLLLAVLPIDYSLPLLFVSRRVTIAYCIL